MTYSKRNMCSEIKSYQMSDHQTVSWHVAIPSQKQCNRNHNIPAHRYQLPLPLHCRQRESYPATGTPVHNATVYRSYIYSFSLNIVLNFCLTSKLNLHPKSTFYHATLCISMVFAIVRCLSVRLSVMLVYCIHTDEDVKLLSRPGSPMILVFNFMCRYPISREPRQWGHKIYWSGKIL